MPHPLIGRVFTTANEDETFRAGQQMAETLREGDILLLEGDLGAGKTVLVRGIVTGLHGDGGRTVSSPSYTLLNIYEGSPDIHHFDLYRLESGGDLESLGLDEYWGRGICLVEWPGGFCRGIPGRPVRVTIGIIGPDRRRIEVKGAE